MLRANQTKLCFTWTCVQADFDPGPLQAAQMGMGWDGRVENEQVGRWHPKGQHFGVQMQLGAKGWPSGVWSTSSPMLQADVEGPSAALQLALS